MSRSQTRKLELVKEGKVVRTETSSKAGTTLTMEVGKLSKDRLPVQFDNFHLTPDLKSLKDQLLEVIASEEVKEIEATEFFQNQILPGLVETAKSRKAEQGEFTSETDDEWIYVERNDGVKILEGTVKFGDVTLPLFVGIAQGKLDLVKYLDADTGQWVEFGE